MQVDSNTILNKIGHWVQHVGPDILIIVVMAIVLHHVVNNLIARIIKRSIKTSRFANKRDRVLRENTLLRLANSVVKIIIWTIAGLLIFNRLFPAINLAALGASAGILGVVIGFGAQSLIKDFGTGTFILLENQYRVGDVVKLSAGVDISGVVEDISLRITVLRDMDGAVHYVPNGTITQASNMTKDYSNINLSVGVGYDTNIDVAEKVINQIGVDMLESTRWSKLIIEPPRFLRVDSFDESSIAIKVVGKVAPAHQWEITGDLRRRIKATFEKNNIDLPLPQRVIHQAKKITQ